MPADPEGASADTHRSRRGEGDLLFRPIELAEVLLRLNGFTPGFTKVAAAGGLVLGEIVEAAEYIKEAFPVFIAQHCCVRRDTEGFVNASRECKA